MNERGNRKKDEKKSFLPGLAALAVIFLMNAADDPEILIAVIAGAFIFGAVFLTVKAAKKGAAGRAPGTAAPAPAARANTRLKPDHAEHPAGRTPRRLRQETPAEEAVSCDHARGKEKYIRQLDSYLKNGIIDRAEYKVLRERYEKLDLPDDYH